MPTVEAEAIAPPLQLTGLLQGRWALQVLKTALQLGVFAPLKEAPLSSLQLACRLGFDEKGTGLLLDALCSLEILVASSDNYALTEISRHYLVPDSPLYLGNHILEDDDLVHRAWNRLTEAIRDGKPISEVNTDDQAEEFFPRLAANIFPMSYTTAVMVAKELNVATLPVGSRVLDIAAGSGAWSIPFARQNSNLTVDALDFPAICQVTREFTLRHEVAERYSYIEGSWSEVAIEKEAYDIVILGHILHCEGAQRSARLLSETYKALKPGGKAVIGEFIDRQDSPRPLFAQLFAINMFLLTTEGCVFTMERLRTILEQSGFTEVRRLHLPFWEKESPVVVATKPL